MIELTLPELLLVLMFITAVGMLCMVSGLFDWIRALVLSDKREQKDGRE